MRQRIHRTFRNAKDDSHASYKCDWCINCYHTPVCLLTHPRQHHAEQCNQLSLFSSSNWLPSEGEARIHPRVHRTRPSVAHYHHCHQLHWQSRHSPTSSALYARHLGGLPYTVRTAWPRSLGATLSDCTRCVQVLVSSTDTANPSFPQCVARKFSTASAMVVDRLRSCGCTPLQRTTLGTTVVVTRYQQHWTIRWIWINSFLWAYRGHSCYQRYLKTLPNDITAVWHASHHDCHSCSIRYLPSMCTLHVQDGQKIANFSCAFFHLCEQGASYSAVDIPVSAQQLRCMGKWPTHCLQHFS